jgi:predicted Zn-dependent protease
MQRRVVVAAAVVAVAVSCATNPATGRRQLILVSEAEEIQLGRQSDASIRSEMGVYDDAELSRYVERIGLSLARQSHRQNLPWTFAVVDESAVNAFALPGGFVYVTRGILPFLRDEAELAAVMGHEVGHVDGKHGVDQYSRQMLTQTALVGASALLPRWQAAFGGLGIAAEFVFLKYGRDAELESDHLGVGYAAAAGYAPDAMPGVLAMLGRLDEASGSSRGVPNWALSHPPAADRVARVQEAVAAANGPNASTRRAAEFEAVIDGVVFGDSREKGLIRGSEFVHPVLRFALRFPDGWTIANSASQVSARDAAQGGAAMILELSEQKSASVAEAARADMTQAGLREVDGSVRRINGLEAFVGTFDGTIDTTPVRVRSAHILSDGRLYLLAGLATLNEFARVEARFDNAIQSFRAMTGAESDRIQPSHVAFYRVQSGDTWESLAKRAGPYVQLSAATLAIMNGVEPATPPRPSSRIRIVVGG